LENKKRRWLPWPPKKGADQEIQEVQKRIAEKLDDPRLHQRLAELYLEKGRKDQAIGEFIKAAECHSEAGFYLRAIALYRRILRMEEDSADILVRLAELYLVNGLLGDALVQYRKVIQQYRKKGKTGEILGLLRRMAEVDPENIEVRTKYAELLRSEGFPSQALDELIRLHGEQRERNRTESLRALESQIRVLYGELRAQLDQLGRIRDLESLEAKVQAVLAEPPPAGPSEVAEEIEPAEERVSEPEVALPAAMPEPEEPETQVGMEAPEELAVQTEMDGKKGPPEESEAVPDQESAVQMEEALLYAEQGLFEEAEQILSSILGSRPDDEEALREIARVRRERQMTVETGGDYRRLNQMEEKQQIRAREAPERRESAATAPSQDARARYELALAYRDLGLVDECIVEFQVALEEASLAFECHRALAGCYQEKGDLERAIEHLRKALRCPGVRKEQFLEAGYELAQTLEKNGMVQQALTVYRKIGETDSAFRDIQERVKSLSQ
jgi:tetratricopeptide (TPR) repeat protein